MDNNAALKEAARKELLRRAAKKELERRRAVAPQATEPAPASDMSWSDWGMDIARGAGTGLVKGVTGVAGGIGDAQQMAGDVLGWGASKLGFSPDVQTAARAVGRRIAVPGMGDLPTSEMLNKGVESVTGPLPDAQSFTGQTVQRLAEYAPAALAGPGSFGRRVATAAAPAIASELAGRIPGVEGSAYQPYVETAAGLAAGLPVAGGGRGNAMKSLREDVMVKARDAKGNPTQMYTNTTEALADMGKKTDAAYKEIDKAGIVFDGNAYKSAAMRVKSGLANRGWDKLQGGQILPLVNRVDDLLKSSKKVANWTKVDGILKDAKAIMRSGTADDTTKGHARVIVDKLENLVKTSKITSKSGLSRDEINAKIDTARDLARRNILGKEIADMKQKLPGYLSGDESAYRNQFGSYFKTSKAKNLSPAERAAYAKVVPREGALNVAHNMGSRLGQIVGGHSGAGIGATIGGFVGGPVGAGIGAMVGGAGTLGSQLGFRKLMDKVTEKAVDDALKTVLAGRKAQGIATSQADQDKLRATIRTALTSEAATRPAREDWFLQDANGNVYGSSGARVPR